MGSRVATAGDDFAEIITKLEDAARGTPALDRAIRDALGLPAMLVPPDGGDWAYPYTTSIDLALDLKPKEFVLYGLNDLNAELYARCWACTLFNVVTRVPGRTECAATAALAICIAALRARAAISKATAA